MVDLNCILLKILLISGSCCWIKGVQSTTRSTTSKENLVLTLEDLQAEIIELATLRLQDKLKCETEIKTLTTLLQQEALKIQNLEALYLAERTVTEIMAKRISTIEQELKPDFWTTTAVPTTTVTTTTTRTMENPGPVGPEAGKIGLKGAEEVLPEETAQKADKRDIGTPIEAKGEHRELNSWQTLTEQQLKEANSKLLQISQEIRDLQKNPVPIGFVYTQLSGQPEPSVIWPTVEWTQVTRDYAGLFFRAEGGNSSSFGQVQGDQSPRLSRVMLFWRTDDVWDPKSIDVPERGSSASVYIASDTHQYSPRTPSITWRYFLNFHNSGGEVRPENQAIRLWKRTA